MDIPFNHKTFFNIRDFNEMRNDNENDSNKNFIIKEKTDNLISKRKEFIKNYRKKQRVLTVLELANKENKKHKNINKDNINLTISDIELEPDRISRIMLLKIFIQKNPSKINIEFITKNIIALKSIFLDSKKVLFDYTNNNIEKQISINRNIIYIYLSLLLEPETNPLIDEFDFEFLSSLNIFCFHYININSENIEKNNNNNLCLNIYIMLILNNLINLHPDVELIKATIDIKNIIFSIKKNFFEFNKIKNELNKDNNLVNINLNECYNNKEFFEFSFLKLIENCIIFLHLNDNDIKELLDIIVYLMIYSYNNNNIKLLIYSLENLANVNYAYLLLENENYNIFLIKALGNIINNNINIINNDAELIKNKLIFELYLQKLLLFLTFNKISDKPENKSNINYEYYLKEDIIIYLKNYLYKFNQSLTKEYKDKYKISNNILKVVIKILKILSIYFDLINNNSSNIILYISLEQKNIFKNNLCSNLISNNNNINISLYDILINIFISLINNSEKNSKKICNLIIKIFINIYPFKNFDYKNDFIYIHYFQKFLIEKNLLHMKFLKFFNFEKYFFLVENMLELINRILFFCEQMSICVKDKDKENNFFEKIKKDLFDMNVFEELENIGCNEINSQIKFYAQQICDNYLNTYEN